APPETLAAWQAEREAIRRKLLRAWGGFPREAAPLEPRKLGELQRDGYRVEKIVFQTRPGVLMTANAYVPEGEGKHPAVLCVHGHWKGAKQDPTIQSRCIGLAKLGFFVLSVDAFGAGERGLGKRLGEYHGEMVAATLFPVGLPLAGLQVYENMRAVDYLQSRPEVDGGKIGITGASGGGNQTMYAGAFDERFGCVVPVCSVGTYQSYLGAACCMCEVVPGAMTFTEEWGLLGLVAPRGLMLVNATRDSFQFSPGEAKKSLAAAKEIFALYGAEDKARHAIFESKHDYSRPMREAMYGWMTFNLKGEGDGSPIAEPEHKTEDPETLRCFPGDSRPDDWVTIPRFAAARGSEIVARRKPPVHREHWETEAQLMTEALVHRVLGPFPAKTELKTTRTELPGKNSGTLLEFSPEPGLRLPASLRQENSEPRGTVVLLDLAGREVAEAGPLYQPLLAAGWRVITPDLRATGSLGVRGDKIGRAPDHNSGEWSMWIGRPLLGQWVWDVSRLLEADDITGAADEGPTIVIGQGAAGVIALCAAALDLRLAGAVTVDSLTTYVSAHPYEQQYLGLLANGILRDAGDIPHLASLVSPRPLVVAGGTTPAGKPADGKQLAEHYAYTQQAYKLDGGGRQLKVLPDSDAANVVAAVDGLWPRPQ
ncbi:MAG: acetylxylan esterase, partial [Planctomycetaceae bacterium]|nr:acetylxylan esterase [Planctomycetaceae bacterium]